MGLPTRPWPKVLPRHGWGRVRARSQGRRVAVDSQRTVSGMETRRNLAICLVEEALTACVVSDIVNGTDESVPYRRALVAIAGEEYAAAHCRWSRGEARPEDYFLFEEVQGD